MAAGQGWSAPVCGQGETTHEFFAAFQSFNSSGEKNNNKNFTAVGKFRTNAKKEKTLVTNSTTTIVSRYRDHKPLFFSQSHPICLNNRFLNEKRFQIQLKSEKKNDN